MMSKAKKIDFKKSITMERILVFILFIILNINHICAQNNREKLLGSWSVISINTKITNQWSVPAVAILRYYKLFNNYEFAFFRSGITYKINEKSFTTLGVAYLNAKPYFENTNSSTQFWIYKAYTINSKLKKSNISNRIRLEYRWINKENEKLLNIRIRYRVQWTYSISKKLYIKSFNEFFINTKKPYFNQNRLFLGLGQTFFTNYKTEIGYLKNHVSNYSYDKLRIAVIIQTNFTKKRN